ncbi:MAG: transporter substrate-binding domain-containing protein [Alphaproteobacteria bacterium]|nr:transporter substrate-binding domain-containing protein [Alphaproteobacteria bacterium]
MLRSFLIILMLLAHSPALASLSETSAADNTPTIALVADEWCPYNCAPSSEHQGFIVDIARAVFEKEGIRVTYDTMPWQEALEKTRRGEFSAVVGAAPEDAPDFVFPNLEQGWPQIQFFVLSTSRWRYLGRDSLNSVRLGVAAAYSYGQVIDTYIEHHRDDPARIHMASGNHVLQDNIELLLSGDIDVVMEDALVMSYYLSQHDLEKRIILAGRLPISDKNGVYLAFSPADPKSSHYAELLDRGLARLRENGDLEAILARYHVKDWRR